MPPDLGVILHSTYTSKPIFSVETFWVIISIVLFSDIYSRSLFYRFFKCYYGYSVLDYDYLFFSVFVTGL